MDVIDFGDALNRSTKPPHLLLGNGFSRACKDDIFSYGALLNEADFSRISKYVPLAFETFETQDFEKIIKLLCDASKLLHIYNQGLEVRAPEILKDAEQLKEILVSVIAKKHFKHPGEIGDGQYTACRRYLANFKRYYTLSYDLLLYWALLHKGESEEVRLVADDGFRDPDEPDQDYVTWSVENTDRQNLFYLHGALHIFDADDEVKKYTWSRTSVPLMTQIRTAIENNMYPLFVAEGTSKDKLSRINHSGYLNRGLRSFSKLGGTLFVHGFAFKENDAHITRLIEKGKITQLFVSIYGNPDTVENAAMMGKLSAINISRRAIEIVCYDAVSAHVWG